MDVRHHHLEELLGAYALDAVDGDERAEVEAHLAECPRCRAEVADHRDTVGFLVSGADQAPGPVWEGIAASLHQPGPEGAGDAEPPAPVLRLPSAEARTRRRTGWRRAAPLVAVAAAVFAVFVGVRTIDQQDRIDRLEAALGDRSLEQAAIRASLDPGARRVVLRTGNGEFAATAVMLADGTGWVVEDDLPVLAPGRTYQLWALVGDTVLSLGVLGPDPAFSPFRMTGEPAGLAISVEPAPGAVQPSGNPVASGLLSA